MRVIPDYTFDDCPPFDVLVVPGGWGTRSEITNQRLPLVESKARADLGAALCRP